MSDTINIASAEWIAIKAHCEARVAEYREQLTMRGLPFDETEQLRARLEELQALLNLPENV